MPLEARPEWVDEVRATLPELPSARIARFMGDYGLSRYDATVLGGAPATGRLLRRRRRGRRRPQAGRQLDDGRVPRPTSTRPASRPAAATSRPSGSPRSWRWSPTARSRPPPASRSSRSWSRSAASPRPSSPTHGLARSPTRPSSRPWSRQVLADNPAQVEQYRAGKQQVVGFFVGQVMKATRGAPTRSSSTTCCARSSRASRPGAGGPPAAVRSDVRPALPSSFRLWNNAEPFRQRRNPACVDDLHTPPRSPRRSRYRVTRREGTR